MALESAFCPVMHNTEFVSASKQSLGDSRVTQGQSTRAFCFSSSEGQEPPHVHVSKGDGTAKLWLVPVELAYTQGLTPAELRRGPGAVGGAAAPSLGGGGASPWCLGPRRPGAA